MLKAGRDLEKSLRVLEFLFWTLVGEVILLAFLWLS
jgi:hypothetical protein